MRATSAPDKARYIVLATLLLVAAGAAAVFLWNLSIAASILAVLMGLGTVAAVTYPAYRSPLIAFRLDIPARYAREAGTADTQGSSPRASVFYFIMAEWDKGVGLLPSNPRWYHGGWSREEFISAAGFLEERFPRSRYAELVELAYSLSTMDYDRAVSVSQVAAVLQAWHRSDVAQSEIRRLVDAYGFDATAVMVEHDLTHEYAVLMLKD